MGSMATGSGSTLVFLETPAQVSRARSLLQRLDSDTRVVALSPDAMESLDRVDQPYSIPDDYCAPDEIAQLGEGNYSLTEELCAALDAELRGDTVSPFDWPPEGLAAFWFYYLKIMTDAVSSRALYVKSVLERIRPNEVLFFQTTPQSMSDVPNFDEESIYSLIIPLVSAHLGIPATTMGTVKVQYSSVAYPLWKRVVRGIAGPENVRRLKAAASLLWVRRRTRKTETGRGRVLLIYAQKELLEIARRCEREGICNFDMWLGGLDRRASTQSRREAEQAGGASQSGHVPHVRGRDLGLHAESSGRIRDLFRFHDVDCWPVVDRRVRHLLKVSLPQVPQTWKSYGQVLRHGHFQGVLASVFRDPWERLAASAARAAGVPVGVYQHGPGYGWRLVRIDSYAEGRFADSFGCYGAGSASHFSKMTPPEMPSPSPYPVGSRALDRISETSAVAGNKEEVLRSLGLDTSGKLVMYVVDEFGGNWGYYPSFYPDTWYYAHQRRMVDLFARYPQIQFLVKVALGHARNPIDEYVKRTRAANVKVVARGRFSEMLPAADAVLIDYPAATLVEALAARVPVLVMADPSLLPLDQEGIQLLRQTARVSSGPGEFLGTVEAYLDEGAPAFGPSDEKFLKLYGTHMGDGKSLERAVAWVQGIVNRSGDISAPVAPSNGKTVAAGSEAPRHPQATERR